MNRCILTRTWGPLYMSSFSWKYLSFIVVGLYGVLVQLPIFWQFWTNVSSELAGSFGVNFQLGHHWGTTLSTRKNVSIVNAAFTLLGHWIFRIDDSDEWVLIVTFENHRGLDVFGEDRPGHVRWATLANTWHMRHFRPNGRECRWFGALRLREIVSCFSSARIHRVKLAAFFASISFCVLYANFAAIRLVLGRQLEPAMALAAESLRQDELSAS